MEEHLAKTGSRRTARLGALALITVIVAGGVAAYWHYRGKAEPQRGAALPAQVTVVTAARRDLPVYLSGLGTVQPTLSVAIRTRLDGKLQEVRFTEGQRVRKDDILAVIDPRLFKAAVDQAKAQKGEDRAQLVAAQKDLERLRSLADKSFATQQNLDLQQGKVDRLTAALAADDAAIEMAQVHLDNTNIVAPSDGRMGVRMVDPGNIVHVADPGPIANLVRVQPAAVMFTLPSRALHDVLAAMERGPVEVIAFDQDGRNLLDTGKLLTIDNSVDQATATFRLKAIFANAEDRLWPGQFVNARLLLEKQTDVITVPASAIQHGPQGLFVWSVTAEGTAAIHPVKAGPTTNDITVVTSGLEAGDRVVIEGQYKLDANVPVTIKAAAAAP
jgi:multidrug efflux system membrane fusion protein